LALGSSSSTLRAALLSSSRRARGYVRRARCYEGELRMVKHDKNESRTARRTALETSWRVGCFEGLRRGSWLPERRDSPEDGEKVGGFSQLRRETGRGVGIFFASLMLLDLALAHPSQALTLDHLVHAASAGGTASFGGLASALHDLVAQAHVPHNIATQGLYVPGLVGDDEFREGFTSGLLLILVSEIGDKTFFVAMLLAVRQSDSGATGVGGSQQSLANNSDGLALKGESNEEVILGKATERRLVVYAGTVAALGLMTVISCIIGRSFHSLDQLFADYIPSGLSALPLDDLAAVILLTSFGVTSLKDARALEEKPQVDGNAGRSSDVVFDIRDEEDSEEEAAKALVQEMKDEGKITEEQSNASLLWQSFLLVFAAEWGDRSFLSTIALTAAYPPVAVVAGATTGHAVATALAVGGGSVLAKYISEKAIAYSAGVLFLAFAAATIVDLVVVQS